MSASENISVGYQSRAIIPASQETVCLNCEHRRELKRITREAEILVNRLKDLIKRTAGRES